MLNCKGCIKDGETVKIGNGVALTGIEAVVSTDVHGKLLVAAVPRVDASQSGPPAIKFALLASATASDALRVWDVPVGVGAVAGTRVTSIAFALGGKICLPEVVVGGTENGATCVWRISASPPSASMPAVVRKVMSAGVVGDVTKIAVGVAAVWQGSQLVASMLSLPTGRAMNASLNTVKDGKVTSVSVANKWRIKQHINDNFVPPLMLSTFKNAVVTMLPHDKGVDILDIGKKPKEVLLANIEHVVSISVHCLNDTPTLACVLSDDPWCWRDVCLGGVGAELQSPEAVTRCAKCEVLGADSCLECPAARHRRCPTPLECQRAASMCDIDYMTVMLCMSLPERRKLPFVPADIVCFILGMAVC